MRSVSPSSILSSPLSSTIIENNLLVQGSPPSMHRSVIERPPPTPVKPVSHFQKLLHHFNGNKPMNHSLARGTSFTSKFNGKTNLKSLEQTNESLPPPPPPEMAHEQILDLLFQSNRTRISSISPSPSTSSAATHTSMQQMRINTNLKKKISPIKPSNISPSMSNSDLSFSPSGINIQSPSIDTFSGYEVGPMSKSMPNTMIESQVWSPPRYITTPSSSSSSSNNHHACHCTTNNKDEVHYLNDDDKFFIQRHWIYDEMFKLLKTTTKPGLVLLTRTPGMGKTYLMKNLLRPTVNSSITRTDKSIYFLI